MLTRVEAAEYLGIKPQTLAIWASTGRYALPMIKIGRAVRYRKEDLDRFIDRRCVTSTCEALIRHKANSKGAHRANEQGGQRE